MKKRFMIWFVMLALVLMACPVYADEYDDAYAEEYDDEDAYAEEYDGDAEVDSFYGDVPRLVDDAGLLDADVERELGKKLNDLAEIYGMDAVIVTVEDYKAYDGSFDTDNIEDFALSYYYGCGFGTDDDGSGIVLAISMAKYDGGRDCAMKIEGKARVAVNDYGYDYIIGRLGDKLRDEKFQDGIERYVDDLELFYKEYKDGKPYGDDHKVKVIKPLNFVIAIGIAFVIALIVMLVKKSGMNTARPQVEAREYVRQGSFAVTSQQDLYLYSHTTKTAKPKDTSSGSGSGGGGRSSGSSGSGGGSIKF